MENKFFDNEKPPTFSGKKLPSGIDEFKHIIPEIKLVQQQPRLTHNKTIVFLNSGLPPDEKTCHYDINWKNKL